MSPGLATTYRYRLATSHDAPEVFKLLEKVAPEIPVLLDTPKRQMANFEQIHRCISSCEVWIALNRDNQIVGFLLAEPERLGRSGEVNLTLDLPYGGVRPGHRGNYIFPTMVKKMMAKGVPLTATVSHNNKSNMASRLRKLGFKTVAYEDEILYAMRVSDEDTFRWQPQPL